MRRARRFTLSFFLAALTLLAIFPASALERKLSLDGLDVVEWYPPVARHMKAPIVLFSHDFRGCATDARLLLDTLSGKGFHVFALNHSDASCNHRFGSKNAFAEEEARLRRPQEWSDATYASRKDEMVRLLAALRASQEHRYVLDYDRIALAGYGLGGYTVLGMGGGWPSWKEGWNSNGIRAVLALSPITEPLNQAENAWQAFTLPVMLQAGAKDSRTVNALTRAEVGAFAQINADKYLTVFDKGDHSDWVSPQERLRAPIARYATAFLAYYLTGEESPILTSSGTSLSLFGYTSDLGERPPSAHSSSSAGRFGNKPGRRQTIRAGDWRDQQRQFTPTEE